MEKSLTQHAVLIVVSIFFFVVTVFLRAASHTHFISGLFTSTTENVSETYPLEVSPDKWIFKTWIMIDVWNGSWLFYLFSTLIRRNRFGALCCNPPIHPPSFYLLWIGSKCLEIGGVFLVDRHFMAEALLLKVLVVLASFTMLSISYWNVYEYGQILKESSPNEVWNIRYLVQNGLALHGTWNLIVTLLNLGIVLRYSIGMENSVVSTLVLTLLLCATLLWFLLENVIFEKEMRYTFTVYPVVILAAGAMFTRNYIYNYITNNTIYCGAIMIIAAVVCIIRLIATCFYDDKYRDRTDPFGRSNSTKQHLNSKFGIVNPHFIKN
ncbi:uncharacterized protein LOC120530392 [Polypterus senegalus]|uniref:uncharacterized protein LOC120530392 n=1 Tax=Polypterus senegalus TaxID=55291 RepID=UPI001963172A|nr:uncharacterized protein LOC120530392 [Polypterus senegalus]